MPIDPSVVFWEKITKFMKQKYVQIMSFTGGDITCCLDVILADSGGMESSKLPTF
jgi:hypothetical protein